MTRAILPALLAAIACGPAPEPALSNGARGGSLTAAGVAPRADCVIDRSGGLYLAFLGYRNDGATVRIAVGTQNAFSPAPANRGQPALFEAGESAPYPASAVHFNFDGTATTWTVQGASATVSADSPRCPDSAPPTWPASARLTASVRSDGSAQLRWPAASDESYVAGYRLTQDGALVAELPAGILTTAVNVLPAGHDYTFKVEAGDPAGNWSTSGPSVLVDRTAPVVSISGVSDGQISRAGALVPEFTATDDRLASLRATLDGVVFASGTPVTEERLHNLRVTARDTAGNTTIVAIQFTLDRTPPAITISGVADGSRRATPAQVKVTATDATPVSLSTLLDGQPAPPSPFTVSAEGPHTVAATAVDAAGNVAERTLSFTIDLTPPLVAILAPAAVVASSQVEVVAAVSDAGPLRSVSANGQAMAQAGDGSWHAVLTLTDGSHTLTVVAVDAVGNRTAVTSSVRVDTTGPVVSVTRPLEGALIGASSVSVTGSAHDLSGVQVSINGQAVSLGASGSFSVLVPLAAGANAIRLVAVDGLGNTTVVVRNVRSNTVPPSLVLGAPPPDSFTAATSVVVSGTAHPADPADSVSVTVKGAPVPVDAAGAFSTTVALVAGANLVRVVATDSYRLYSTVSVTVTQDAVPPRIAIGGVSEGQLSNAAALRPTFTATDAHLAAAAATLDGAPFASGSPVSAEGDHTLVVTASDRAGNQSTAAVHFALDRTPPLVSLSGAVDGETRATPATIVWSASDDHLVSASATADGAPFTSGGVISSAGHHLVLVTAADGAGNSSTAQLAFTIDTAPPALEVIAPADGSVTAAPVVEVVAAASDDSGIARVTANGVQLLYSAADGRFHGLVSLVEGPNLIQVVGTDLAGNVTGRSVQVVLDTHPPELTVEAPAEGARIGALSVEVSGSVTDATAISLTVAGNAVTPGPDGRFSAAVALSPGANAIEVRATDAAGNATAVLRHVRANTTPPTLAVLAPAGGSFTAAASVTVIATAAPADSEDTVSVTVSGTPATAAADGSFQAAVALVEGPNAIVVTATDGYGLSSSATLTVVRDTVPPQIAISGVADGQVSNAAALAPAWTATDAWLASTTAMLDGAPWESGMPVSAEGDHVLLVSAVDRAGNTTSATVRFALDRIPPRIEIAGVADGARVAQSVALEWSVSDAHPGSAAAMLDGAPFASGGVVSAEGPHTLLVNAGDAAGNAASRQVSFAIDRTPPAVSIVSPAAGSTVAGSPVEVVASVAEAGPLAGVTANGAPLALASDGTWRGQAALVEGANTLAVIATDGAGNVGEATATVVLDTTPPALSVSAPAEGARVAALTVAVSGTVSDASPVRVTVNGAPAEVLAGAFTASAALVPGANTLSVMAVDAAENASSVTIHVRANLTPPSLSVQQPADGSATAEVSVEVRGTATAADSEDHVAVTVAGASAAVAADGTFAVTVPLAPGANDIHVAATDGYGLSAATDLHVSRTVPADGGVGGPPDAGTPAAPSIYLDTPAPGAVLAAQSISVTGHVLDGAPPLAVTVDGSPAALSGSTFAAQILPPEGAHDLVASVSDGLGRSATAHRLLQIDRTPPSITLTRPAASPATASETPYLIEGTVADANLAEVTVAGTPVLVLGGSFQVAVPLALGESDVVVAARDLAGNQSTFTQHFSVNVLPPVVTVLEPPDGSEAPAAVITVRAKVTTSSLLREVLIGGATATPSGSGEFTALVPLALGGTQIVVSATDVFGLTGTAQVLVHYRDPATEPLTVQALEPAPGAGAVEPDAIVSITFNKQFDPRTIAGNFVALVDGAPIDGGYSVSPSSQTASFVPRGPLPEGKRVQVRISGVQPRVGPGMSGDFTSDFTVRRPLTQVSGVVLDQQHKPLADVGVELRGQGLTTRTGVDGNWTLFAARGGTAVVAYEGGKLPDGRPLPSVRHTLFVNTEGETADTLVVLVPTDGASAQRVDATQPVRATFNGVQPGLSLETAANSLAFPDGQTTGYLTATRIPSDAAPTSRVQRHPVAVWQLGPAQASFSKPVTVTMPNLHGLAPGKHAPVFAYDPDRNQVLPLGLAVVSADGQTLVSDPLPAPSFEFFGYGALTDAEQAFYVNGAPAKTLRTVPVPARAPQQQGVPPSGGKGAWRRPQQPRMPFFGGIPLDLLGISSAFAQPIDNCVGGGCASAVGLDLLMFLMPNIEPRWTHVSGRVQGPGEDQTVVEESAPAPASKKRVKLPFSQPASFTVTRPPDPKAASNQVNAQLTAFANGTAPIAAPAGESWTASGDGVAQVSGKVPLVLGTNKIVLTGQSQLGVTSTVYLAQLDVPTEADAGVDSADLTLTKVVNSEGEEPLKDAILYPGVVVEIGGEEALETSDQLGHYIHVGVWWGLDVEHQNFARIPLPTHGVRMPDGRVRRVPGVYYGQSPPYTWDSYGMDGVNITLDARNITGTVTFVDKDGKPLPPACDDGQQTERNDQGEVTLLSARSVGTTELHFFREDDLEHPIAQMALAGPVAQNGDCSTRGEAHGYYSALRIGPSDFRRLARCNEMRGSGATSSDYFKTWCMQDQKKDFLQLKTHDRIVVFAVNHDTGYSGITTVEVPPVSQPNPACKGQPDVVFNFRGKEERLKACTAAEIGIPASVTLYPPELDLRVERRAPDEGAPGRKLKHLVRQGGSATTRDDFLKISTHWRVRKAPNAGPTPPDAPDAGGQCEKYTQDDGGVVYKATSDGGDCRPARIRDSDVADAGAPLEVYCSQVPEGGDLSACLRDDTVLVDVPAGVPPIAGRIWSATGTAAGEPLPIVFDVKPGANTTLVSPSVPFRDATGAVVTQGNLTRANYFVQVVGKPVTPQEPPPPDFRDDPAAQGRPRGAVGLKNVYRALDGTGTMQERFDRSREHQFSVVQIGDHSVTAQTGSGGTRDLSGAGSTPAASEDDVSYRFLMALLEPDPGDVSRTPRPGNYELRLGGDVVGETCQLTIQASGAGKSLTGTCAGESLMDVLSADDILYLELYLSGNAENVLYRFNFAGLTLREDQLPVGMATTGRKLTASEAKGTGTPRRPVMSPPLAEFFAQPSELKHGVLRVCLSEDCSGDGMELKSLQLEWDEAKGDYQVTSKGGRKDLESIPVSKLKGFGIDRAVFYTLPLPNDVLAGGGPSQVYVRYEPTEPKLKPFSRALGRPRNRLQSQAAQPPGHEMVGGIDVGDGHLALAYEDLHVPEGGAMLRFVRRFNNQNNEVHPLGLGWSHNFEGQVLEEKAGRYTVIIGGQSYDFPTCEVSRDGDHKVTGVTRCTTDRDHGGLLEVTVSGDDTSFQFTRGNDRVLYGFDRRSTHDSHQTRGEGGRRWLLTSIDDGMGKTGLTYKEDSDLPDKAERQGGRLTLQFRYHEVDKGPAGCGDFSGTVARRLKQKARDSGFQLLSEVQILRQGTQIDHAVFEHEVDAKTCAVTSSLRVGNLTGVRRDTGTPSSHWVYTYPEVDKDAGDDAWVLRNELEQARFLVGAGEVLAGGSTFARDAKAAPYEHLDGREVVDRALHTGQGGVPIGVQFGGPAQRTLTLPGKGPVTMQLNDFGNLKKSASAAGTDQTDWESDDADFGAPVPTLRTSAGGEGLAFAYDHDSQELMSVRLQSAPSGAVGTSTVAAGDALATGSDADSRWAQPTKIAVRGLPGTVTRTPDATGQVSELKYGGFVVSQLDHAADGTPTTGTLATGATITYSAPNELGLPTLVSISNGGTATLTLGYDELGRLNHRANSGTGADETWTYDGLGRTIKHTAAGEPAMVEETRFTDVDDGLNVEHLVNGTSVGSEVFAGGLLTTRKWAWAGGIATETRTYGSGNRLATQNQEIGAGSLNRVFSYDADGRLTGVTVNGKVASQMDLDADGKAKTSTDQDGLVTKNSYDALGRQVGWDYGGGDTREIELDATLDQPMLEVTGTHAVKTDRDAVGRPILEASVGAAGGLTVSFQGTDAAGRVTRKETDGLIETFAYLDPLGRRTQQTRQVAGGTLVETWSYTGGSGLTIEHHRSGGASEGTTISRYDGIGRLVSETQTVDGQPAETRNTYDGLGHLKTTRLPNGGTVQYESDAQGAVTQVTDPEGIVTRYTVDALGRKLTQTGPRSGESWTFQWDEFNRMTSRTLAGPNGGTWTTAYGAAGLVTTTDPAGITSTQTFNPAHKVLKESRGGGLVSIDYEYDGDFESSRTVHEGGSLLAVKSKFNDRGLLTLRTEEWSGPSTGYTYSTTNSWSGATSAAVTESWGGGTRSFQLTLDGLGNVLSRSGGRDQGTWSYDAQGLLVSKQLPGRAAETYAYEQSGRVKTIQQSSETTTISWFPDGLEKSRTGPDGRTTSTLYDHDGRATRLDLAGRVRTQVYSDGGKKPNQIIEDGKTTQLTYGPRGEVTSVALPGGAGSFTYGYDADARLKTIQAPGMTQSFDYDGLDRIIFRTRGSQMAWRTTWGSGTGTTTDAAGNTVATTFDPRGRPALKTFQTGAGSVPGLNRLTFSYTDLDQVAQAVRTDAGGSFIASYLFDSRGRVTAITANDGDVVYGYGDLELPTTVITPGGSVDYAYDEFGRVRQAGATTVTWEPGGARLRLLSGRQLNEARCYTPEGFLSAVVAGPLADSSCSGAALSRFEYTYDPRGNRLTEKFTNASGVSELVGFGYDDADRLTSVNYPDGRAATYGLTATGTRKSETRVEPVLRSLDGGPPTVVLASRTLNYALDDGERLLGITDGAGAPIGSVISDAAGRIQRLETSGVERTFGWDAAGRVVTAKVAGPPDGSGARPQSVIDYRYDHANRRVEVRSSDSGNTSFVWGTNQLEESQNGIPRLYERAGDLAIAVGDERLIHDGADNVVGRWDGASLTAQSRMDVFGNYRTGAPGPADPTPGFAGQSWDARLGLSYAQQRWYAPELGRFLSEDPIGATPARLHGGMGLGGFAYANGNPARWTDPTGMYEADFHHGLTEYLARLAGFSRSEASQLGEHAEAPDRDERDAVKIGEFLRNPAWLPWRTKAGRDEVRKRMDIAAKVMREWHFPLSLGADGELSVVPNSVEARAKVDAAIAASDGRGSGSLKAFGEGLHVLQDSFSHSGRGAFIYSGWADDEAYAQFGHPKNRGNWWRNKADHTHEYPLLAWLAAQATFDKMLEFRVRDERLTPADVRAAEARFIAASPEIESFINARFKDDKLDWLNKHSIKLTPEERHDITLPWRGLRDRVPGAN